MYGKYIKNGYIIGLSVGAGAGKPITEKEYNKILAVIENRPQAPEGYTYRLTTSLEWELCELPPVEANEEENIESEEEHG